LEERRTFYKKNILEEKFSKFQNDRLNQDGSKTIISQPILKCKTICRNKHYGSMAPQLAQKIRLHFKIG
jgi:hypothetical protein